MSPFGLLISWAQTVSAATTFLLAMVTNPEVQARAQEEIDRVVGTDRLPTFSDREVLPYVTAVMKETLRWHPPAPQGASQHLYLISFTKT